MVLSGAERARRCREEKKNAGLSEIIKEKDRKRKQLARSKMTLLELTTLRHRQRINLQKFRAKNKTDLSSCTTRTSFSTKQSKGKALKKILNVLPTDKHKQIELITKVAEDLNILTIERKKERDYQSLPTALKDNVYEFYCRDDISYQAPGKRDTITIKENGVRKKLQKNYLLYTLRELYELFMEENPNAKISLSSFQDLRPAFILYKSSIPHNMCVCVYYENIASLIKSLRKHVHGFDAIDLSSFVKLIVCDDQNELCMFSNCNICADKFLNEIQKKIIDPASLIKWTLRSTSSQGRAVKVDFEGSVAECVKILSDKVKQFLFHVFIKRQQSFYFELIKSNVDNKKCLMQVDYSENYAVIEQNEIQSAHWSRKRLSLFIAHVWTNSTTYPLVIVSNNVPHNKYTVATCLERTFTRIQTLIPSLEELVVFSDGSASQFKQRFLFKNLSLLADKFKIKLSWNFFASNHGKGVVDGIGGSAKRMVYQDVMSGKRCTNSADFARLIQGKNTPIIIEELLTSEIDNTVENLQVLFDNVKAVPNIQKLHSITVSGTNKIECKVYSNSTDKTVVHF